MSRFVPLSDLAVNITEKVVGATKAADAPYVGLEHLITDQPRIAGSVSASASVSVNTVFRGGDTLFAKLRPNLRKVALADFDGYCSTDILVLRPANGNCAAFLSHQLRSRRVLDFAAGTAFGTKMPRTPWSMLKNLQVYAPPVSEQRRIAEILDTLDDQIRTTGQIIAKLEDAKQGAIADFMTRGVGDDGSVRAPYEEAPDLYVDRGTGPRPKAWIEGLLDDFAIRGSGHTPNKNAPSFWNGGIKWVSLADSSKLDQLYIHTTDKEISAEGIANSSAVLHPAGTVILSRDAGVGKSSILAEHMAVSQHFMAWKTGPKLVNTYLYYWLQYMKREFEAIAMGSTIKTIGLPYFRKLRIFVPSLNERERIAECLLQADRTIAATSAELMDLRRLKDGLMSDLLAGRVRVPTEVAS
jgi:type I restriction enzyme, S subunit